MTLDMLNLINLFNSDKGLFEYMSFGQLSLYAPVSSAGNTTVTPTQPLVGYNLRRSWRRRSASSCVTTCARAGRCSWGGNSASRF